MARAPPAPGLRTRPLERSSPVCGPSGDGGKEGSCKAAAEPLRGKCAVIRRANPDQQTTACPI